MPTTETITSLLHENWVWLVIILAVLLSLRRSAVQRLSSIDETLGRIEAILSGAEERRKKREQLGWRNEYVESQRPKWHEPPEPPARRTCHERLQELQAFVEHRGGFIEVADIPNEVSFSLPQNNNVAIMVHLQTNKFVTPLETVLIKGKPATSESPGRPGMEGRLYMIDLLSIDDDQLEQITRRSGLGKRR
jgi:hypothetical protein